MPSSPAVVVDGVQKTFHLPREQVHTLKERALHPLRRGGTETLRALRNVSFSVEEGEFFGIVGRNGSGKSTMLKCLAGVYKADAGNIYVRGQMSTFIELGVGFNPDLAAYDNVMLNATMLGLSKKEARNRFEQIIDFAELHDFTELKLKNYSSGMLVRLAFSVMIQVDAEILLIDEVLAVGDAAFQQKCFEEFARIRKGGTTVILVTHDMNAVRKFCDRAMLLEKGRMVEIGKPDAIGQRYLELNFSTEAREHEAAELAVEEGTATVTEAAEAAAPKRVDRHGTGDAEILDAWIEDAEGKRSEVVNLATHCRIAMRVRFDRPVTDPIFTATIEDEDERVFMDAGNVHFAGAGAFAAGDVAVVRFGLDAVMSPGRYSITLGVSDYGTGLAVMDRRDRFVSLMVIGAERTSGAVVLPFTCDVSREPSEVVA